MIVDAELIGEGPEGFEGEPEIRETGINEKHIESFHLCGPDCGKHIILHMCSGEVIPVIKEERIIKRLNALFR